jgi:hypothetical protein
MDKLLKKAIENELIRKPSQGFSDKVMSQVFELKGRKVFQPLISPKIWIAAVVCFTTILGISAFLKPQETESNKFDFVAKTSNFISNIPLPKIDFFMNVNLLIISGICLALFLLMFFDLILFKKK